MPAPVSEPLRSTTSRRALAPRAWPRARDAIPRPSWVGCTPITPRVLTRSGFAAPAAAPPLRSDCGGASRRRLRRPAYGRPPPREGADPAPRWTLKRLMLSVRERFGCLCCRETLRAALHRRKLSWKKAKKLLGRADPERRQAFIEQLQSVLEGAQRDSSSSRACRRAPNAIRAAPERAGGRPTRSASAGLRRRGPHPPGGGSRLWLGRTRAALLGCLPLAGSLRARLLLWALPVQ